MRVLVTGHRGYIGTVMVPLLLEAGHRVTGLDSDLYESCTFEAGGEPVPVPTIRKDIRDVTLRDMEGYDAVIHLAALSNDALGDLNPEITYTINHKASLALAITAKQAGVPRFLFSSSCSNYGVSGVELIDEDGELNPVAAYGHSKVMSEHSIRLLADSRFCPVYFRLATAYGVSPRLRFDIVLNSLVGWAVSTGVIALKSDGSSWRPIVHVEDISRAFLAGLTAPRDLVFNQTFNVGSSDHNYRVREIAEIAAQEVPGCRIGYATGAGPDNRSYRVSFEKITRVLGFRPKWNPAQGAAQLHEAYRRSGLAIEDFEGPRFQRIGHIRMLIAGGRLDQNLRHRTRPSLVREGEALAV